MKSVVEYNIKRGNKLQWKNPEISHIEKYNLHSFRSYKLLL